jgi:hypothetical protein
MAQPERREIDWGAAEIRKGTLTVELTGAPSKDWKKRFTSVLGLLELSSRGWGEVELTKDGIEVEQVREGAEGDLRHQLESVVLEVNSQLQLDDDKDGSESGEDEEERGADERMTATFRTFAATDT